jgi:hypothetical protein
MGAEWRSRVAVRWLWPLADLKHAHRQRHLALLRPAGDVEQIPPHHPVPRIGVEVGIGLAVGRRAGDGPVAVEVEEHGHQARIGGRQPPQPPPAVAHRLPAEHVEPDDARADPIEPFHHVSEHAVGNQGAVAG